MLIQVIYQEDKRCGAVHKSRLDYLIRSGLLFAFRRADGWVIVGKDPVRGESQSYTGFERRSDSLSENLDCASESEDEHLRSMTLGPDFSVREKRISF